MYFVTRLKKNASYKLIERCSFTPQTGVTSDNIIEVKIDNKTLQLRRVGYTDIKTGKHYEFLTNHFKLSAKTIANVYKNRWQIEIFFRKIKQNLKIKRFIDNSENVVMIQIYTALTVYLLLAYQKFLRKVNLSVQQILELATLSLLMRESLDSFLNPQQIKYENLYNSLLAI